MKEGSEQIPRIAVLVDTSSGWGRRLIGGISNYVKKHSAWDIWIEQRGQGESLRLPRDWRGDAVIARVSSRQMAEHLLRRQIPVVNVSSIRTSNHHFATVVVDEDELATMAVEHFRDRGLPQIGYLGLPGESYSLARKTAIEKACEEAALPFLNYTEDKSNGSKKSWSRQQQAMQSWIKRLPKPIGILTWDVTTGLNLIRAAVAGGHQVPEEVAILSGDDDDLLCEMSEPMLSGIVNPSQQIGYQAASLVASCLDGANAKDLQMRLKPTGIALRGSTDVLAINDADVALAIRFIRANADKPIQVSDVAELVAISRRALERRFHRVFNRTIGDEIVRVHLERAKYLLAETDLPVSKVADASGYGSPEYFSSVFRKSTGRSALRYRMQCQGK